MANIGYDDTPVLPGSRWKVHDGARPQPRVVTPGPTAADPPSDAIALFDGSDLSKWKGRNGDAEWKVENGYMEVVRGTGDIQTRDEFGDIQLHLEFACPAEVKGDGQGRGNSGVFLGGRYEVQVLDGYENQTYADGTTAAVYGQYPPLVNANRKPGEWQTYEIIFTQPRWDGDSLIEPARITVLFNGALAQNHVAAHGPTGHRSLSNYDNPHPPTGPLRLQDHGDPVRFRNIWLRELSGQDE